MLSIGLTHYIILSTALFCIGIIGIISSRNLVKVLMSVEILLNAVNINFIAFANYVDLAQAKGHVFSLLVMAVAAAEIALGLAILIALYRNNPTVDVEQCKNLKG